jgi:hypothetical protein
MRSTSFSFIVLESLLMPHPIIADTLPDPEILARIGEVAVEWSYLESVTNDFLAFLCEADLGAFYVVTQNTSNSSITNWIKTLVEVRVQDPDPQKIILDTIIDIDETRMDRNTVVHGLWNTGTQPGFAHCQTLRWARAEVAKDEMWSLADFDELIDHIRQLQGSIVAIRRNIKINKVIP